VRCLDTDIVDDETVEAAMTTLEKLEQIHFCILEYIDKEDGDLDLLCQALDLVEDIREPYLQEAV